MVYTGGVEWPSDGQFHTLEIRRSASASTSRSSSRSTLFDLFFDRQIVAKNVSVVGLNGPEFQATISGRADALGTAYAFDVDNFKVYREAK